MTEYKLCGEGPRWAHVKPEEPDTVYLGGALYGMNFTMWNFPESILDPRLSFYACIEDFIEDYIEVALSHELCHIEIYRVDGSKSAEMWDNVDWCNELTGQ